jgi:hypothetical protein
VEFRDNGAAELHKIAGGKGQTLMPKAIQRQAGRSATGNNNDDAATRTDRGTKRQAGSTATRSSDRDAMT